MKILIATDYYFPSIGGVSTAVRQMTQGLAQRGHDVRLLAPSPSWRFYEEKKAGVTIYRIRSLPLDISLNNLRYSPPFLHRSAVRKIISAFQPDIVHIHVPHLIPYTAFSIAKSMGIPVVATAHTLPENVSAILPLPKPMGMIVGNLYVKQIVGLYNHCDLVISPTEVGVNILKANGLQAPVMAMSNGIDLSRFEKRITETKKTVLAEKLHLPSRQIALYTGRLDKEKHLETIVRALPYLHTNCHVIIAGEGKQKDQLVAEAEKLGVSDKITFVGFVRENQLLTIYRLAKVFLMPSTAELQCLSAMEAMASELPVIAANAKALPYLVKNGENGYLFTPLHPKSLAEKLDALLSDKKLQKEMGKKGKLFIQKHALPKVMMELESHYLAILEKRKKIFSKQPVLSTYPVNFFNE
ncbi:MAG TPA: glycosyltransferase [Patescibacteria group bacterium]|nr:glycosyltransferase [Patescibacteria group bacterium]